MMVSCACHCDSHTKRKRFLIPLITQSISQFCVSFRGIIRLGSAFFNLQWLELAHICIRVITLRNRNQQGIHQQLLRIGNRLHATLRILNPIIFARYIRVKLWKTNAKAGNVNTIESYTWWTWTHVKWKNVVNSSFLLYIFRNYLLVLQRQTVWSQLSCKSLFDFAWFAHFWNCFKWQFVNVVSLINKQRAIQNHVSFEMNVVIGLKCYSNVFGATCYF